MKKLKFNAGIGDTLIQTVMAQKMFDEWFKTNIESAPVIYSNEGTLTDYWRPTKHKFNTHVARLIMIEEIKKEPCKHEPKNFEEYTINWKTLKMDGEPIKDLLALLRIIYRLAKNIQKAK